MRYLTKEQMQAELKAFADDLLRRGRLKPDNRIRIDGKGRVRPPTPQRKYAKRPNDGERFVYVIGPMHGEGAVKIGVAADPKRRLKALQTAHPTALKLYYGYPVPVGMELKIERQCHEHFQAHRVRGNGEWFNIDPKAAVDLVRELGRKACAEANAAKEREAA